MVFFFVVLPSCFCLCCFCGCCTLYRNIKKRKALKEAGLENFELGNLDKIHSSQLLNEQAEFLPFDSKYEFPKNKLKIKRKIGSGAFGVVYEAIAERIFHHTKETTVAVRVIKPPVSREVLQSLVAEMKIMIHLENHINVVNLLGAVTKNLGKLELMMISEYCEYGNLRDFLIKNQSKFGRNQSNENV
jgi:FMS-like tyrosine kinase 1